ncbi:MAG: hypothetical protein EP329_23230 [Deltaproteobacteria bacterium]|nr:MAG: hypothetical protein EP329_23230 [Deltaproteobacteria bacterium]
MKTLATSLLAASALLLAPLAACDSSSGGGGGTPANTNSVNATVSGGASATVENEQANAAPNVFGAGIAGSVLNLWILGQDGTTLTVIVDTAVTPLPATVTVGVPTEASAWITMTSSMAMIYNTFDGSGTITLNHCPAANGAGITGSFDGVSLKSELDGSVVKLDGSFNLIVGTAAGTLTCKSTGSDTTDTVGGDDTTTSGSCEDDVCDGPCCPYVQCQAQCAFSCVTGMACMSGDGPGCQACIAGCWDQCNASAACKTAADAVMSCGTAHGCDLASDDTTCVETHCCAELKTMY